jgi:hypothetical protein
MSNAMEVAAAAQTSATPNELRLHLSHLTRGLSCLFWGLPVTLVISVQTLTVLRFGSLGVASALAPSIGFALLLYGLILLGHFRSDQTSWATVLDRTRLLALTNLGLSPFLHWYQRMPDTAFFATAVGLLALTSVLFLISLNALLRRLALALPDPLLQLEMLAFTRLNAVCLLLLPCLAGAWMAALYWGDAPLHLRLVLQTLEPFRMLAFLFLTLLPLSITMSLTWKSKETIVVLAAAGTPPP